MWENPLEFNPERFTDESLRVQAEKQAKASAKDDPEKFEIAKERMRRRMAAGRFHVHSIWSGTPIVHWRRVCFTLADDYALQRQWFKTLSLESVTMECTKIQGKKSQSCTIRLFVSPRACGSR